ncbi:MAG: SusD/RagB family nutrient-binding outer membrane lipoprotein [Mucinivorans sp.]
MKTANKLILGLLALAALGGCKERMIEMNTNPGIIGTTNPEYQFLGATWFFDRGSRDHTASKVSQDLQLFQYAVNFGYGAPYLDPAGKDSPNLTQTNLNWGEFYGSGYKLNELINYINSPKMAADRAASYQDVASIARGLYAYEAWRCFKNFGAAVFSEAFKGISDGILTPKYDMAQDQFKVIDKMLKTAAEELRSNRANQISLGQYDYFYGYTNGAKSTTGVGADVQRANWAKFFSATRMRIAMVLSEAEPAFYESVMSELKVDDLISKSEEGCYFNYPMNDQGITNTDDQTEVSYRYGVSSNFIDFLKKSNDPRLPLLVRINGLSEYGPFDVNTNGYALLQAFSPDSLNKLGTLLHETADNAPMSEWNVYQGLQPNPDNIYTEKPTTPEYLWWNQQYYSFKFINANFPKPLWVDQKTGTGYIYGKDSTISIQCVSRPQGRYFIAGGGHKQGEGNSGQNGWDGPYDQANVLQMRQNVLTYADQCFMLAHLASVGKKVPGGSAAEWYNKAVKAAFKEISDDAIRYRIQIATNPGHPVFPAINPNGLYVITDAMVDEYLAANPYAGTESVSEQAWVYYYTNPWAMWDWWRLTGYPRMVRISSPAQETPNVAYFVQPTTNKGATLLTFPRRGKLGKPNDMNNTNYQAIKTQLTAVPGYGIWDYSGGRIWWDKGNPVVGE